MHMDERAARRKVTQEWKEPCEDQNVGIWQWLAADNGQEKLWKNEFHKPSVFLLVSFMTNDGVYFFSTEADDQAFFFSFEGDVVFD